ncbi:adaptin N terminal region-domain containing protein [Nitzschia inconspicua]|uniref:AP-2 complex subunit alpha n=1 Tax=Nitzschia inconspicua TaxID=303405 RepID=A0A9K3PR74_9STRA|nr:adaptin N terminal region-domain containing protein [Nitzschia inconspicua]
MSSQARGLQNFISDLRNAKSKEEEQKRVDKELANIRKKFTATGKQLAEDGSNNSLNSYSRKKYVWKLVYIHVLGYDVDFGHAEVLALVRSTKYSEKHVGYTALSLLLRGDDPMMNSILNTIRKDLTTPGPTSSKNNAPTTDTAQSLALCSIANITGLELIQTLHSEVQHTLMTKSSTPCVKKKAALCLLRLVRTSPKLVSGKEFVAQMAQLLQDKHLGVLTSSMSLLYGLATQNPSEYQSLIPYAVHILGLLVLKKACAREYLYYRTPSPWLQIKLLKFLQLYPQILSTGQENDGQDQSIAQLVSVVSKILTETDVSDSINKSNADHAVLFEAVNLIVTWGSSGPAQLREGAMKLLGKFISVREPNIRYLGLLTMAKLAQLEGTADSIKKHQATVLVSLKDADISVRRRALDLLFVMCDTDNAERIVDELVAHLVLADAAIREEMVLKIAILAEKYATDLRWYVDTILKLISISGDHVSDAIWHRVVQIVTNHPQGDLQAYTAATLLVAASPRRCHETAVRVAAYVLGEFGFLVAERPGMSGEEQFRILHQHWATSDATTRAILVSTYAKLANLYEECRPLVAPVFARCKNSVDVEIQQRSAEYAAMREAFSPEAVEDLLREMPPFEDKKQSALEQRLREKEGEDSAAVAKAIRPSAAQRQRQQQSQAAARAAEEVAAQQAAEQNARNDPISPISDGSPGAGQLDRPTVGIPRDVIPAMRKAFSNLCTSPSGVLFENSLLQVGVKHEYVGAQGRISVFFGNLSKAPLLHFRAIVDDQDHLKIQKQGTQGLLDESDDGGCTVAVRTQAKLLLLVEVTAPFDDAPAMRVMFETEEGELHEYPLRLPIVATCFMEPVTLEPGAFMQRWRSLEGQDRECQEVVKAPPNAPAIDEEYMKRIANIITDGLKFGRCQGCDPTPWTVSGAATFRTGSKDANGNNINVGCLVRVEANPQAGAFRVTTRTLHPLCSKAVKNVALVSIKLA